MVQTVFRSLVKYMDKRKLGTLIKKIRRCIIKHKSILAVAVAIMLFALTPPFVNLLVNTEAFIFPSFFGFVTAENKDTWINFFGAIIGGGITLFGVAWTIIDQSNKRREDVKDAVKPALVSGDVTHEAIKGIRKDTTGTKTFECSFTYKNVGKGILYNPGLYDIICTIDDVPVTKIQPPIPIRSYVDIGGSVENNISITLSPDTLQQFYTRLKGRGNTFLLKIVLHVGGDDMYGRPTITKLIYTKHITWGSPLDIELELFTGKLVSEILFDTEEISKIVENRSWHYKVY